jgi:APA family basic amino acid/polyamine antiporter
MAHVLGGRGATVVAAIAIVTTTNTTLLALTAASRVLYGMAKAGAMPRHFTEVHARRGSPGRAIVAVALVSLGFAGLGDFAVIAAVTDFAVYVVFLAVNATVIVLRLTRPEIPRPFAVAGAVGGIPVLPVVGFGSVAVMMTQLQLIAIALGTALCAVGLAAGWLLRSRR